MIPWKRSESVAASIPSAASSYTTSDEEGRPPALTDKQVPTTDRKLVSKLRLDTHVSSPQNKNSPNRPKPNVPKNVSQYASGNLNHVLRRSLDDTVDTSNSPAKDVQFDSLRHRADAHLPLSQLVNGISYHPLQPDQPFPAYSPCAQTLTNRDLKRAHASLSSTLILARNLNTAVPGRFNPTLHHVRATTTSLEALLQTFSTKKVNFLSTISPRHQARVAKIMDGVKDGMLPLLRGVADEAEDVSGKVMGEMAVTVRGLQEEVGRWGRKKRGRVRRRVWRVVSGVVEWGVVGVMWVLWAVVVVIRSGRWLIGGVVRGVRWVLWL